MKLNVIIPLYNEEGKIDYVGSLSNDLKTIQANPEYTILDFIKDKKHWKSILVAIVFWIGSCTIVPQYAACWITPQVIRLINEFGKAKRNYKEKRKEVQEKVKAFENELLDGLNSDKSLNNSIVITEKARVEEDNIAEYIDYITNDIYYLDNKERIAVLREIKKYEYFKGTGKVTETELYKLEEDEIKKRSELPVKQVLKLK